MPSLTAPRGRLSARRLALRYLVARDHPRPHALQGELDRAFEGRLPGALTEALGPRLASPDPSIWLIRRLEIDLSVNAGWGADRLARALASRLAREVGRAIDDGGDGVSVIRFAHPAEYLARFVADLAEGRAWARWYYERFAGLRALPLSAALRTALAAEPATGLAALATLSPARLTAILDRLTPADARRTLASLALAGRAPDEPACLAAVWDAYRRLEAPMVAGREERIALRIYVESCRAHPALAGPVLAEAAGRLVRLARLGETAPARLAAARHALTAATPAALWKILGADDAQALSPLFGAHADWVDSAVRELARARRDGHGGGATSGEPTSTRHGGVFPLLPLLAMLPLADAAAGWPAAEGTPAVALIRLCVLAACLGPERAVSALGDPVVRAMAGVPPSLTPRALAGWRAAIPRDRVAELVATLARWQRERGAATGAAGVLAPVRTRAGAAVIVVDCARGMWAAAAGHRAARPSQALRRLAGWLTAEAAPGRFLCLDRRLAAAARRVLPDLPLDTAPRPGEEETVTATLARLDRVESDLTHVMPPPPFGGPRPLGLAFGMVAQGLLRAFAWKLPGFARASLVHLHTNFLDVRASVEDEPRRRVVRLARAPLHLVLSMTGMTRASFSLPWLDDRVIALYPDEQP